MITKNKAPSSSLSKGRRSSSSAWNLEWIFKCFLSSVVFFYLGICIGWNMERECNCSSRSGGNRIIASNNNNNNNIIKQQQQQLPTVIESKGELRGGTGTGGIGGGSSNSSAANSKDVDGSSSTSTARSMSTMSTTNNNNTNQPEKLQKRQQNNPPQKKEQNQKHNQDVFIHKHTGHFASGMEFVDRDEFGSKFDMGVPLDNSGFANKRVLLLYSDGKAMPDKNATTISSSDGEKSDSGMYSVEDATKNCLNLHVVLTSENRQQQCIAVMGQYESFHIQKFMRMVDSPHLQERHIDSNLPLRIVNRGMQLKGDKSASPPTTEQTKAFWKSLTPYLQSLEDVLKELKPVAESVASNNKHNTIIVIVCNFGQSELLLNFVCNARAKGKETEEALQNILVFATDPETHDLATNIGLTSFYSEAVFGATPKEAAKEYGDMVYSQIMGAKVYCVHLISMLGYNLLFQDVDVIWYKNPLTWFHNETNPASKNYDMIFQDDGARTLFYAPYSANTGFYYVRNNDRTRYFFNSLLMAGDLILSTYSHQTALIALLAEHASMYGLKIKTWSRLTDEFPGGHSYHQRPEFMKKLIKGRRSKEAQGNSEGEEVVDPYIFHMSWTENKDNKLKYFEQMGEWFLTEECNSNINSATNTNTKTDTDNGNTNNNATTAVLNTAKCCAAKPFVKCHYRDKPSLIPCSDAPPANKEEEPSFW